MSKYILYCDESIQKGQYNSNFYGGVLLLESDYSYIVNELNTVKKSIGLTGELKWSNVSKQTLEKYKTFIDKYFELMTKGYIKLRIMFTQEYIVPKLTSEQQENEFYILYYQFIKHVFGIAYTKDIVSKIDLKVFLDRLPKKKEQNEIFKDYIFGLQFENYFSNIYLNIEKEHITDVDSRSHVILQGMDIILGSMAFRLNNKHLEKPVGSKRRGKKTIAKEHLYKYINKHIQGQHLERLFNIGDSTGTDGNKENRWIHTYRHWKFTPKEFEIDESKCKHKKSPTSST